jgi:adenylate kinase family enzyme
MKTVILLIGPSGSGKTCMAKRIAKNPGWSYITEDDIWNEIDHDPYSFRTPEKQAILQPLAVKHILKATKEKNVVFEFLVYEIEPITIEWYQKELEKHNLKVITKVIKVSIKDILKRQKERNRNRDKDIEKKINEAEHQLKCLDSKLIKKEWIIDTSNRTLEENYVKCFKDIVE